VGAATVVSFSVADNILSNPIAFHLLAAVLYTTLSTLTSETLDRKNQHGGWTPCLKSFTVPDERLRVWSSPAFDAIEHQVTHDLICPITMSLVCAFINLHHISMC